MNVMSIAAAAVSAGLSAMTVGMGVAAAAPAAGVPRSVLASAPSGISWSFEWDDDGEDWSQTASWDCPAGCSVTWEDW